MRSLVLALTVTALACSAPAPSRQPAPEPAVEATNSGAAGAEATTTADGLARAWFATGCFWCTESDFEKVAGVVEAISGYAGGSGATPTYEQVSAGRTGHAELVEVRYDPARVSYQELLEVFWRTGDPTDAGGQFCDRGDQYRNAIFVAGAEQRAAAEASRDAVAAGKPFAAEIVTTIEDLDRFWPAEEYHQDYAEKNPLRYTFYRRGCRRDARLAELWGTDD